jgi:hypothetical protein
MPNKSGLVSEEFPAGDHYGSNGRCYYYIVWNRLIAYIVVHLNRMLVKQSVCIISLIGVADGNGKRCHLHN